MNRTKARTKTDKLKWGAISNEVLYKSDSDLALSLENISLNEVDDLAAKADFDSKNHIALTFTYTNPETGLLSTHRIFFEGEFRFKKNKLARASVSALGSAAHHDTTDALINPQGWGGYAGDSGIGYVNWSTFSTPYKVRNSPDPATLFVQVVTELNRQEQDPGKIDSVNLNYDLTWNYINSASKGNMGTDGKFYEKIPSNLVGNVPSTAVDSFVRNNGKGLFVYEGWWQNPF